MLRGMWRNKVFSFINLLGLAAGMVCSMLIFLWIADEVSYDRFHVHDRQLYRVMANLYWGEVRTTETTPGPLANALQEEIPEVSHAIKMTWNMDVLFKVRELKHKENGRFASAHIFDMFTFPLIQGDPKTALTSPSSIVITEKLARKYFGEENALGKTIQVNVENTQQEVQVTGIMQDILAHSSLQFDWLMSQESFEKGKNWLLPWGNFPIYTYVLLHPDASLPAVQAKIKNFIKKKNPDSKEELFLQRYSDMYLYSNFSGGKQDGGRIEYIQLFVVIALFILLIACINFMNLSTARSGIRAKEVGIRKVLGAIQPVLVRQFMGEAILMAMLSMVLSLILLEVLFPVFNTLTGKSIHIQYSNPLFISTLLGITLVIGIISGTYPSFFLSALAPIKVLKDIHKSGSGALIFRKALVIFQFTLSILLIIGTTIVYRQIQFIKNKNLGFNRENLLIIPMEGDLKRNFEVFKQELSQQAGIKTVTTANLNPLQVDNSSSDLEWPGKPPKLLTAASALQVGYDFITTMDLQLVEGRDFSKAFPTDSTSYIINESAADLMQMKQPVGQTISFWTGKGTIIGVVKDFHISSLHEPIKPLIIALKPQETWFALLRTEAGKTSEALTHLENIYHTYNPGFPFEYHFLDETFEQQYRSEMMIGQLAAYFASLAIFISCLGLFGLAAFTAEQRTREIGIRKVLGATASLIVFLLSKDFIKLVLLSLFIAIPLAAYAMGGWLENFAYHITMDWWMFALPGLIAILIALLTVSYHAIKTAYTNPVKTLRNE